MKEMNAMFKQAKNMERKMIRMYKKENNKQLLRSYYCAEFNQSERTFYRKVAQSGFNMQETEFLLQLMGKGE